MGRADEGQLQGAEFAGFGEARSLVLLAMPLTGGYLAELAKAFTDMIIVGRLGSVQLAATCLSVDVVYSFLMLPFGILSMTTVLVGAAVGAGDKPAAGAAMRDGICCALLLAIPAIALCLVLPGIFAAIGEPAEVVAYSRRFLAPAAWGMVPILVYAMLRSAVAPLGAANAGFAIMAAGIVANVPLCYGLVHGGLGLPRIGVAGAGIATTTVNWLMLAAAAVYFKLRGVFAAYRISAAIGAAPWRGIRRLLILGMPAGAANIFEYAGFAVITVIIGTLGAATLAGSQIVFNTLFAMSLLAYGIGDAATVRISYRLGRGEGGLARRAGATALALASILAGTLAIALWAWPLPFIGIFIDLGDPANLPVIAIARRLFAIGAAFQLFDALQAVLTRLLRGYKDTLMTMASVGIGYWAFGVGVGSLLAFGSGLGAAGMWLALTGGIFLVAVLLGIRYRTILRRQANPVVASASA
jgi:multidrug resistance protein, MATE family